MSVVVQDKLIFDNQYHQSIVPEQPTANRIEYSLSLGLIYSTLART